MKVYKIVKMNNMSSERFKIVDNNGKLISDAQGYGYKDMQKAHKAANYILGNGKSKKQSIKSDANKFWITHKEIAEKIKEIYDMNFKDITIGAITENDIIDAICDEYKIDKFPIDYFDYMD